MARAAATGSSARVMGRPTTSRSAPSAHRGRRRRHTGLVVGGRTGRPDPRRDQAHPGADRVADGGQVRGAHTNPGAPASTAATASAGTCTVARRLPDGVEVPVRHRGEHGHGQDLAAVAEPPHRRLDHRRAAAGVDGQQPDTEVGDACALPARRSSGCRAA